MITTAIITTILTHPFQIALAAVGLFHAVRAGLAAEQKGSAEGTHPLLPKAA